MMGSISQDDIYVYIHKNEDSIQVLSAADGAANTHKSAAAPATSLDKKNHQQDIDTGAKSQNNPTDRESIPITVDRLLKVFMNGNRIYEHTNLSNITVLELRNCNLREVPVSVGQLNVEMLILSNNRLEAVPRCLYVGLESLRLLDLSHNCIADFEDEPKCRSSLERLHLNDNRIKNLPGWILAQRCENLIELNYSFNRLRKLKTLMNRFDYKLKAIIMKNCCMRDEDLVFLRNIPCLEELDISNEIGVDRKVKRNHFDDLDLLFVRFKWKQIQVLNINNLELSVIPGGVVWLETIRELYLSHNHLSFLPDDLLYLQNLEVLDISDNEIVFLPEKFFSNCYLRVLKAANNKIDFINDSFCTDYLEVFDLYNNKLRELGNLNKIKTISHLDLELNYFDTESELCSFYDRYVEKKDAYRHRYGLNTSRNDGQRLSEDCSYDSDQSCDSDDFYVGAGAGAGDLIIQECNNDFENWDLQPDLMRYEKHPDVTPSDDEWQGEKPPRAASSVDSFVRKNYLVNDYQYCDADDDDT